MKTIAQIINLSGGLRALCDHPIRIENPPFMRLVIEHIGQGPRGLEMITIAHYCEQNGDLIADPDLEVEPLILPDGTLSPDHRTWGPAAIQHGTGLFVRACWRDEQGRTLIDPRQIKDIRSFMGMWSKNLKTQGFLEAFKRQRKSGE